MNEWMRHLYRYVLLYTQSTHTHTHTHTHYCTSKLYKSYQRISPHRHPWKYYETDTRTHRAICLCVCVCGVLIRFNTHRVCVDKWTALLSISSLKLQCTKDSLKNTLWNRWCFWRHKPPWNQSDQRVIDNQWISEWRRGSSAYS